MSVIISLIVALTINRVIGRKNSIPWYYPEDMAWFKYHTLNKPVIMGRKTFESIGKPLPNRLNIVLSHKFNNIHGVINANTPERALSSVGQSSEVMIIGGEKIFNVFLLKSNRLYLTHVNKDIDGDVVFPEYDIDEWRVIFAKYSEIKDKESSEYCNYWFEILERLK